MGRMYQRFLKLDYPPLQRSDADYSMGYGRSDEKRRKPLKMLYGIADMCLPLAFLYYDQFDFMMIMPIKVQSPIVEVLDAKRIARGRIYHFQNRLHADKYTLIGQIVQIQTAN